MPFRIVRIDAGLPLPHYAREGDAGMDLYSRTNTTILPRDFVTIATGVAIELPAGFHADVRSRSGLGKHGVAVLQGVGTVDSGYRGEIGVTLINNTDLPFLVYRGDRIAQLVVAEHVTVVWDELDDVADLAESERGTGGFGHTLGLSGMAPE